MPESGTQKSMRPSYVSQVVRMENETKGVSRHSGEGWRLPEFGTQKKKKKCTRPSYVSQVVRLEEETKAGGQGGTGGARMKPERVHGFVLPPVNGCGWNPV